MTTFMDGIFPQDYNCFPGAFSTDPIHQETVAGGRAVTIWGPVDDIYLPANGGVTGLLRFTPTKPSCYSRSDNCLVTFRIHTTQSSSSTVKVTMRVYNLQDYSAAESICNHSTEAWDDCTETIDIVPGNFDGIYNDTGPNALHFTNNSDVNVWIQGLQIVRVYEMYNLYSQNDCSPDQTQSADYDFTERNDYACNPEGCGGVSYTAFNYDNHIANRILFRATNYEWEWTNPPATFHGYNTYEDRLHTLFNFNNLHLCDDQGQDCDADTADVPFWLKINNSAWKTCYMCKNTLDGTAHSLDLATDTDLKDYYDDSPSAYNKLSLYIPDSPDPGVNLRLDDGDGGKVNLYRVYKTKSICAPPCESCVACQTGCQISCVGCYMGQGCWPCYGFCQTCVGICEFCESGYNWSELCESGYNWPCLICESGYDWCEYCESAYNWCALCQYGYSYWPCDICETCYSCNTVCEVCEESCQVSCQECYTSCQPCNNCQTSCQLGCQMCYELCYDCQGCNTCQEGCYACEDCYGAYTP
jgi:hypothetical protein